MASKAVHDAVKARLTENWTACPVFGPNERTDTPDDASAFIDLEFPVAVSGQITIGAPGANLYREDGVFRLIIAAQRGAGVDQGLAWADELAALFRGKEFDGVQTFAPNPPVIDDSNDNGNYFTLSIACQYWHDTFG